MKIERRRPIPLESYVGSMTDVLGVPVKNVRLLVLDAGGVHAGHQDTILTSLYVFVLHGQVDAHHTRHGDTLGAVCGPGDLIVIYPGEHYGLRMLVDSTLLLME